MSDLKHQSVEELQARKEQVETHIREMEREIGVITGAINNQKTRLEWINRYIYQKTPKELTLEQVEEVLGHKLIRI